MRKHAITQGAKESFYRSLRFVTAATTIGVGIVIAYMCFRVGIYLYQVPNLAFLEKYNPVQTIQVFDRNDKLVCAVEGAEKRQVVPLTKVSLAMQKALLAAEDHRFYEHHGLSAWSIVRAVLANLTHGRVVEGGSTITQQLSKNLFFEGEKRTLDLKVAELLVAMNIESKFSKHKILELYLNEIYFGNNAYGIEQAALNYFGKHASELNIAESAFLAGIIRSPSNGGKAEYRAEMLRHKDEIIDKMLDYGFINNFQSQVAKLEPLMFMSVQQEERKLKIPRFPYYVSAVIESIKGKYNSAAIERQGLKIYTNMDIGAQELAERTLAQGVRHAPYGVNQAALVSIRVSDGAVLALVGGVGDYLNNQWNCATNPHTAGSAFKPFVYLSAFEKGILDEYSFLEDSPMCIKEPDGKDYKPKNFDGRFMGGITVAKAVALSRNICALRVAQSVGIGSVIDVAERAGIKSSPLAPHLSLALGCSAVSPLEMANAYSTIARGGYYIAPYMVRKVETRTGRLLDMYYPQRIRVFEREPVAKTVDVLQDCVAEGTGQLAKLKGRPVAGKTGTADQSKDLWFVGFTPDLVTAVWGGNKDNKPVGGGATGGTVMARIWHDYNQAYYRKFSSIPPGFFVAANRSAAPLGEDRPLETASSTPVQTAYYGSGYQTRTRRKRASRRTVSAYGRTPTGAAIVRSDSGITEYAWSRR